MSDKNEENTEVKTCEYVKDLLKEKTGLTPDNHPHAMRLLDDEISKAQAIAQTGKIVRPEARYVDVYKEKPVKITAKVLVPVKEHPKFNFVGKLLGPKGNSLKRLQEETQTKMAILGCGSMRDKTKEEELKNSQDPKYSHLSDELHVEISALASPAEAYARIAFALAEVRKFLIPDGNDEVRQEQFREIQQFGPVRGGRGGGPGPVRGMPRSPMGRGGPRPVGPPGRAPMSGPPIGGVPPRGSSKSKVMSILDRARVSIEDSYGSQSGGYDDYSYSDGPPQPPMSYDNVGYSGSGGPGHSYNGSGYYDGSGFSGGPSGPGEAAGGWKAYGPPGGVSEPVGGKAPPAGNRFGNARPMPYTRPAK